MLATSKNVVCPGHNHLLTTRTCWSSGDNQSVKLSALVVSRWFWPGNTTFLEVAGMVVKWRIVAFLRSALSFWVKFHYCAMYCYPHTYIWLCTKLNYQLQAFLKSVPLLYMCGLCDISPVDTLWWSSKFCNQSVTPARSSALTRMTTMPLDLVSNLAICMLWGRVRCAAWPSGVIQVSMIHTYPHKYPHKPRLTFNICGLMSDLAICKHGEEYGHTWHWMVVLRPGVIKL